MSKKKKKGGYKKLTKLEKVLLATAIIELISSVIDLIAKFIE